MMTTKEFEPMPARHKAALRFWAEGGANILHEDACLPALVIKETALDGNIRWMQRFADAMGVSLAPHGKTTMTPAIFQRQLAAGAWGLGVATAFQAQTAMEAGAENVIIANQLLGRANMKLVASLLRPGRPSIYCCVDSLDNARQLSEFFAARRQWISVLLEMGAPGGRCGCRTEQQAYALAEHIAKLPGLMLAGVAFYEGVIHGDDERVDIAAIQALIQRAVTVCGTLQRNGDFAGAPEVLLTGAGSVWFDIVSRQLRDASLSGVRHVIRPGCYVTQDHGIYQQAYAALQRREPQAARQNGGLAPALELCALVQSLPEPGLAVVGFGKRDVAFDAGLPQPFAQYRQGRRVDFAPGALRTRALMDQHALLDRGPGLDLRIGDLLVFGSSHPCLSFDKWKCVFLVDEEYRVREEWETVF
ncbi:amino acid deaminase [Chromobacterium haemolyticum]|uniref:amino acid deaminase n=1 Tax=Chromobacterium haemolyticum TaxID=394935 RepID=UPI00307D2378